MQFILASFECYSVYLYPLPLVFYRVTLLIYDNDNNSPSEGFYYDHGFFNSSWWLTSSNLMFVSSYQRK